MSVKPKFILSRDGNDITISILNRDGKPTAVFRSPQHNNQIVSVTNIESDTFNETIASGLNVGYVLRFRELELSFEITEDNTDQTPPHYVAEPIGDTVFTEGSYEVDPSWGAAFMVDTIDIDPLQFGTKSIRQYTKE